MNVSKLTNTSSRNAEDQPVGVSSRGGGYYRKDSKGYPLVDNFTHVKSGKCIINQVIARSDASIQKQAKLGRDLYYRSESKGTSLTRAQIDAQINSHGIATNLVNNNEEQEEDSHSEESEDLTPSVAANVQPIGSVQNIYDNEFNKEKNKRKTGDEIHLGKIDTNINKPPKHGLTGNPDDDSFRIYKTNVKFAVRHGQRTFDEITSLWYRIGVRGGIKSGLKSKTLNHKYNQLGQTVMNTTDLANNFVTVARKYSNFNADFRSFDLAALVEQLAAGIMTFNHFGVLPSKALAGGCPLKVMPLQEHDVRVAPSHNSIFIPALFTTNMRPAALSAIILCSAAVGSTIVTDTVQLDMVSRRPIITVYENAELAQGCVAALQYLGAQYEACGAGDVFALATTRGFNRVASVVGQSDEGSFIRHVLRCNAYVSSYGGICTDVPPLSTLPTPLDDNVGSFRVIFDSIMLLIAATVAESDPGVIVNNKIVPFVSCCEKDTPESEFGNIHMNALRSVSAAFSKRYVSNLNIVYGLQQNSGIAATFMNSLFSDHSLAKDRHLQYRVIAPFYWIENTSIIPQDMLDSIVDKSVSSAFASNSTMRYEPMFGDAKVVTKWLDEYIITMRFTNMRSIAGMRWLGMRERDGLTQIRFAQCDPGHINCAGPDYDRSKMQDEEERGLVSLQDIRWRSRDNNVPKPAEGLYTGEGVSFNIIWTKHPSEPHRDMMGYELTALPSDDELSNSVVGTITTMLSCVGFGGIGTVSPGDSQSITRGLRMIKVAIKLLNTRAMYNKVPTFIYGDVIFDSTPTPPQQRDRVHIGEEGFTRMEDAGQQPQIHQPESMHSEKLQGDRTLASNVITMPVVPEVQKTARNANIGEPILNDRGQADLGTGGAVLHTTPGMPTEGGNQ